VVGLVMGFQQQLVNDQHRTALMNCENMYFNCSLFVFFFIPSLVVLCKYRMHCIVTLCELNQATKVLEVAREHRELRKKWEARPDMYHGVEKATLDPLQPSDVKVCACAVLLCQLI